MRADNTTAAGLNVTEPASTGIGGDMFCLYYNAATGQVSALNGSGRAGAACALERIRESLGIPDGESGAIPMRSVHAITVPGAAAGWVDTMERFGSGKVSLAEILAPAIELAENGFPVSELTAYHVFTATLFFVAEVSNSRSGNGQKNSSAKLHPTLPTFSRLIRLLLLASALPGRGRFSSSVT